MCSNHERLQTTNNIALDWQKSKGSLMKLKKPIFKLLESHLVRTISATFMQALQFKCWINDFQNLPSKIFGSHDGIWVDASLACLVSRTDFLWWKPKVQIFKCCKTLVSTNCSQLRLNSCNLFEHNEQWSIFICWIWLLQ